MNISKVSLIIPSHNDSIKLSQQFMNLMNWELLPKEIIVIDSSKEQPFFPKNFEVFAQNNNISLSIIHKKKLYPGHARNIGIDKAKYEVLAFLDTHTIPGPRWLSDGIKAMDDIGSDGVWGKTYYEADKFNTKIIRACTFGSKPIRTLPGSIIKKSIFNRCGLFIETTRAGEDGDWIARAEIQDVNIIFPKEFLTYGKLNNMSLIGLLKKWFRNYSYSSKLPHRQRHKDYYYYGFSIFAILFAYNWNRILAAWDTTSIFYIPNITKISLIIIVITYVFFRGILLPRSKGVPYYFIFPINFLYIVLISMLLDIAKVSAFIYSKISTR